MRARAEGGGLGRLGLRLGLPTPEQRRSTGAQFGAILLVHRVGPTNADLSVSYDIGGTASNGVDYVTLPGAVTLPAGQQSALITVVPLDDDAPDRNSTVVLKLKPSPDYFVGRPAAAAALSRAAATRLGDFRFSIPRALWH